MLEGLLHLFARRSLLLVLTDVGDILLVAYVIYRALLVLRGTRAMQGFDAWLSEWVTGVPDRAAYIAKLGARWTSLRDAPRV